MKALMNWRYYVIVALCLLGFFCLFAGFSDSCGLLEYFLFELSAALLFYSLSKCIKHWERHKQIPEWTNAQIDKS